MDGIENKFKRHIRFFYERNIVQSGVPWGTFNDALDTLQYEWMQQAKGRPAIPYPHAWDVSVAPRSF